MKKVAVFLSKESALSLSLMKKVSPIILKLGKNLQSEISAFEKETDEKKL